MAGVIVVTGAARGMGRACAERLRCAADHLVAADLAAPDIEGTTGVACDVSDPAAIDALAAQVRDLGAFRALVHVAGISPTMGTPRQIFAVDLVGTQLLLDAFEPLVGPGAAAVCFASSSAYQVPLFAARSGPRGVRRRPVRRRLPRPGRGAVRRQRPGLRLGQARRGAGRRAGGRGAKGGRVVSVSPGSSRRTWAARRWRTSRRCRASSTPRRSAASAIPTSSPRWSSSSCRPGQLRVRCRLPRRRRQRRRPQGLMARRRSRLTWSVEVARRRSCRPDSKVPMTGLADVRRGGRRRCARSRRRRRRRC